MTRLTCCAWLAAALGAQVPPEPPPSPVPDLLAMLRSDERAVRLAAADRLGLL